MLWVWVGVGVFVAVLLAISWWYDRDARRRGATPRSGREMSRARWAQEREIAGEMSQLTDRSMTPKAGDALRDAWRGRSGQG